MENHQKAKFYAEIHLPYRVHAGIYKGKIVSTAGRNCKNAVLEETITTTAFNKASWRYF